jgi:hypothetical protein
LIKTSFSKGLGYVEMTVFPEKNKKDEFIIVQKKKKHKIIQESKNQVDVPPVFGDEKRKL